MHHVLFFLLTTTASIYFTVTFACLHHIHAWSITMHSMGLSILVLVQLGCKEE